MTCESILIASGDSLDLSIDWGETALLNGAPDSLVYQVFDYSTQVALGPEVPLLNPGSISAFTISGDYLKNYTAKRRRVRIEISAFFGDERKTVFVDAFIERIISDFTSPGGGGVTADGASIPFYGVGYGIAIDGIGL